mgnify:FL=1
MDQYVIDTHALLWYLAADRRIGNRAKEIIAKCEDGEVSIVVPSIVLVESIEIINKGRITYPINDLLKLFDENPQFIVKPLDAEIVNSYRNYQNPDNTIKLECHDKIIIVTSTLFGGIPILTQDGDIEKVHSTIW